MKQPLKTDKQTQVCSRCRNSKIITKFVKNKYIEEGYDLWCKECRAEVVVNFEGLMKYTKANKRPFHQTLWNRSLEEARVKIAKVFPDLQGDDLLNKIEERAIGYYLRQSNLSNLAPDLVVKKDEYCDDDIPMELIRKWGQGYHYLDYLALEEFEEDMKRDFTIETKAHKDYLKKIAKISLKMDKALDGNQVGEFKNLSQQYDLLMKSAKFTAVQRTASDATGGLNTFSDFYRLLEEEGFIPVFPKEDRDIVDSSITYMEDYLKRLFLNDPQIMTDIELGLEQLNDLGIDEDGGQGE